MKSILRRPSGDATFTRASLLVEGVAGIEVPSEKFQVPMKSILRRPSGDATFARTSLPVVSFPS
jgi:hypothetical protein